MSSATGSFGWRWMSQTCRITDCRLKSDIEPCPKSVRMITAPGKVVGRAVHLVSFALKNADKFSLQDCIWRGTYYTPKGPSGSGYGHYDHVHITTHGGGYPRGGEVYLR